MVLFTGLDRLHVQGHTKMHLLVLSSTTAYGVQWVHIDGIGLSLTGRGGERVLTPHYHLHHELLCTKLHISYPPFDSILSTVWYRFYLPQRRLNLESKAGPTCCSIIVRPDPVCTHENTSTTLKSRIHYSEFCSSFGSPIAHSERSFSFFHWVHCGDASVTPMGPQSITASFQP
ncbi:hypothetical protein BDV41DRAFT_553825 [Aspergillus transmontanensis]|uniref:Uncharacterized protein n=1 Tax=Aspergillus transmontanensis TaxID=1034304 RepID=A0A5N6VHH0_9EURO|nr:hypothetical protein BDV41DRAFT_553825 [Aspergillus transmontanensis]